MCERNQLIINLSKRSKQTLNYHYLRYDSSPLKSDQTSKLIELILKCLYFVPNFVFNIFLFSIYD